MSTLDQRLDSSLKWLERIGDNLNAILVKETRQSLKSRQFIATFMLLVFASWIISVFGVAMMGDSINYGSAGQSLFMPYFFVLMVAVTIIVPYGAYRSMLGEKDQNTFDSLRITSLTPWQIVWGKLLSAVLQDFIYYSAIAPFIAFTSLLEGFELPSVAFVLCAGLAISIALSIVAIMVSTFAQQRHWQGILSIFLLLGLISMLGTTTSALLSLFSFGGSLQSWEFWLTTGLLLLLGISYCWLFLQITAAQLTFESGNRSTGIRLITTGQFLLMGSMCAVMATWFSTYIDDELILTTFILMICQLVIVSLVAVTEEDFLSRRIRKSLSERGLVRFLLAPFLPGGSRGLLYLLVNIVICFGLLSLTTLGLLSSGSMSSRDYSDSTRFILGLVLYILIYLGFAGGFARTIYRVSGNVQPNHIRVGTIVLFAVGCLLPMIAKTLEFLEWRSYSLFEIINPFTTIVELVDDDGLTGVILIILSLVSGAIMIFNLKAMLLSWKEILALPKSGQSEAITITPFQIPDETPDIGTVEG